MKYHSLMFCSAIISSSLLVGCGGSSDTNTLADNNLDTGEGNNTASAQLVINEIVADAADGGHDWIELYVTQGTVDLSTYTLVDDNADHTPQALPAVTLAQGEYIVIQAIDEEDTPPENGYYVTFKLGKDDAVFLYNNGALVDTLDWQDGDAPEGHSYGLFADGTGDAQSLEPTPSLANKVATEHVILDSILNHNAPLRINEIVAKDQSGGADWIELYVTGNNAVNLAQYSLTDSNNERVSLPDITLNPGDFYQIYATTDVLDNLPTVAFKLGSSDSVSLYQGDDLVDQLEWKKGQALIGASYGRFPDGSDATHILMPSAQGINQKAKPGPLIISEVVASDANEGDDWFELYNNSEQDIALSNYTIIDSSTDINPAALPNVILAPGDYIRIFATDLELSDYYVPFKLGKDDELSLLLNDETVDYIDWDSSDVIKGFSYGLSSVNRFDKDFLTPTEGAANKIATAFNKNVVNQLSIEISNDNWQNILNNPLDEEYHEASISFNGVSLDSVAIRTKGGSSLRSVANSTSDRYSFKVDINEYVSGQKFFGLKKFTLQNSFNDPSYMREVIAYDLLDEMGVATPEHAYVNFYVNGELFGLYLMVEAVDGEFIENHFANTNGDMYKPDGVGSDLKWINNDINSYSGINLQTNEETTDNGAFIHFVEQMAAGSTDVIDIDSMLRYMSVSVSLANLDSYHGALAHNYYIYEQDGVFSFLPWDLNEAFGSFNRDCNRVDIRGLYIDEPTSGPLAERPMLANVFANQDNLDVYHDYLWQLINGPLAKETFAAKVNAIANLISEHVENDPTRFYSHAEFQQNLNITTGRFYGLTDFMEYRVDNMTKQLNGTLPRAGNGRGFCN